MNEDIFNLVKDKLRTECYLTNDEWLRDCVEFYVNQHENPSTVEIFQFVKVQWQLSDLREISNQNGSLPPNLSQQKFITLSENYMLQVEQMYDISTSKYKQMEQIRKTHISEVELSEAEKLEKWEPPKKRMIQLQLTDGLQDIIGIEYSHIAQLNDTLLPGYKVMIKGPVKCHKGVLLLEERNFKGIGGEIDCLLVPNALENILARALNLQENPDPYNDNQTKASKNKQEETQIDDNFFKEDFDINLEEFSVEGSNSTTNKFDANRNKRNIVTESSTNQITTTEIKPAQGCDQNNIMDDDDYFLEMIDEGQFAEASIEYKNTLAPYRVLPQEENDDIIIINEEHTVTPAKYNNLQKGVKVETYIPPSSSKLFANSTDSLTTPSYSKMEKKQQPLLTNGKRSVPMSPSENKPTKKGKIDRKITEFAKVTNFSAGPKICDFIRDINNELITETTFKTIRGRVEILGKLTKKDSLWILGATVGDGTGTIEVSFSNKVLQNLLGLTVQEFSIKKKLKKNPEIERELRTTFRTAEEKVKTMDALLELQLKVNEKPSVMKITDLTQEQKELIDKRLQQFVL